MSSLSAVSGLSSNVEILSNEEKALSEMLLKCGQEDLFSKWAPAGTDDDKKHAFFEQIANLNKNYPGGITAYTDKAKKLLKDSKDGVNPLEGWTPSVPVGEALNFGDENFTAAEKLGAAELGGLVFVLVAGGLGERLGYGGIKVGLPSEITTETCYLELYCKSILALQARANAAKGVTTPVRLPLAIMVSDDTATKTKELLEKGNYFGMERDQIIIMKQEKVAALIDNDARLAQADSKPYEVLTKPHGHGDVHLLLHMTGLASRWAEEGRKWVVFFQDTNALGFKSLVATLGVSARLGLQVNSMTVPRQAGEAVGAITRLTHTDGREMTVNTEYNQLDPLLRATVNPEGDVNDERGLSPYPGNINQLVFALQPYAEVLHNTGGGMDEFVNPKYATAERTVFKAPTRLECMMQDYPKGLAPSAPVGFTTAEKWLCFSPVKNNIVDGRKKSPPGTASSGEADVYEANCKMLRAIGVDVAASQQVQWDGVTVEQGPRVVLMPSFATSSVELRQQLPEPAKVHVEENATLVVEGNVRIESLRVSGALVIRASPGANVTVRNLEVTNKGYQLEALGEAAEAPEYLRIRGYQLSKTEEKTLEFLHPGTYVVDGETVSEVQA